MLRKYFLPVLCVLGGLLLIVEPILAQAVVTTAPIVASSPTAVVVEGNSLAPLISAIGQAIGAVVLAAALFLIRKLPEQFASILMTWRVDQLLKKAIDYAINMATGYVTGQSITVNVGNEVLAHALTYVLTKAPAWLIKWTGGIDSIADMIIARLNVSDEVSSATLDVKGAIAAATSGAAGTSSAAVAAPIVASLSQ